MVNFFRRGVVKVTGFSINEPNVNSKIIFIGDPCQLPPVGDSSSKEFEPQYLKEKFNVFVVESELKEVNIEHGSTKN